MEKIKKTEKILKGIPVSPGIAIGKAFVIREFEYKVTPGTIGEEEVEKELNKFREALKDLIREIELSKLSLPERVSAFLDVQLLMLKDTKFVSKVEEVITRERRRAVFAVHQIAEEYARSLERSDNLYLKERASEVMQLARDLIARMQSRDLSVVRNVKEGAIVFVKELSLNEAIFLVKSGIEGLVMEKGGKTSHVAILLRDFQIPGVFGIGEFGKIEEGATAIIDGGRGIAIIEPKENTLEVYREKKKKFDAFLKGLEKLKGKEAITQDGIEVGLALNIDFPEEIEFIEKIEKRPIGLFRTEVMFFSGQHDEETQYQIYRELAEKVYPHTIVIRVFDIGGDKLIGEKERNPFLGLRGLRVLLKEKNTLREQLRAILAANKRGNIKILLPMVTTVEEIFEFKPIFEEAIEVLKKRGEKFHIPDIGIMVETPAVALTVDLFKDLVDFISIGTNDLTQYVLAVDRRNPQVSYLYDHFHPALIRLMDQTVKKAHEANLLVSICGEMGSDPLAIPILVALNIDTISVVPAYLLQTKEIIRLLSFNELEDLKSRILTSSSAKEVKRIVLEYLKEKAGDKLPYLTGMLT